MRSYRAAGPQSPCLPRARNNHSEVLQPAIEPSDAPHRNHPSLPSLPAAWGGPEAKQELNCPSPSHYCPSVPPCDVSTTFCQLIHPFLLKLFLRPPVSEKYSALFWQKVPFLVLICFGIVQRIVPASRQPSCGPTGSSQFHLSSAPLPPDTAQCPVPTMDSTSQWF